MKSIEVSGITTQQVVHEIGQMPIFHFHKQVEMIVH